MAEINLKEYTSRAKELEAAIFTQRKLMQRHDELLKSQYPVAPKMKTVKKPVRPKQEDYHINKPEFSIGISVVMMYIIGIVSVLMVFVVSFWWIFGVLIGVIGVWLTVDEINSGKRIDARNKELAEEYIKAEQKYARQVEGYNHNLAYAQKTNEQAQAEYNDKLEQHTQRHNAAILAHTSALSSLQKALDALYAEDIIFPKYRNLVAITAINEYLLSGRCYSLEGPDGAYNLYEMELRQNIVIGQLSNIISNLEQIRSNQYSLYEQLTRSNALVENIMHELRDIRSDTQLTAYFAEITALAETSPKFYIGTSI